MLTAKELIAILSHADDGAIVKLWGDDIGQINITFPEEGEITVELKPAIKKTA